VLFELSILLARWIDRIKPVDDAEAEDDGGGLDLDDEPDDDLYQDEYLADDDVFDAEPGNGARLDSPTLTDPKPKD
jgi:hypothetical protein